MMKILIRRNAEYIRLKYAVAVYLRELGYKTKEAGFALGIHYTTVIHACSVHDYDYKTNAVYRKIYDNLSNSECLLDWVEHRLRRNPKQRFRKKRTASQSYIEVSKRLNLEELKELIKVHPFEVIADILNTSTGTLRAAIKYKYNMNWKALKDDYEPISYEELRG